MNRVQQESVYEPIGHNPQPSFCTRLLAVLNTLLLAAILLSLIALVHAVSSLAAAMQAAPPSPPSTTTNATAATASSLDAAVEGLVRWRQRQLSGA